MLHFSRHCRRVSISDENPLVIVVKIFTTSLWQVLFRYSIFNFIHLCEHFSSLFSQPHITITFSLNDITPPLHIWRYLSSMLVFIWFSQKFGFPHNRRYGSLADYLLLYHWIHTFHASFPISPRASLMGSS